jgi:hypothetical protein
MDASLSELGIELGGFLSHFHRSRVEVFSANQR